ncbi:MAG: FtsX-like permease family protein [Planctomycetota bacterium]
MYKLLLSWRYLKTRFIALASIVSVTLGVATLIVVNSVMAGFVEEMKSRLHGVLSDVEMSAPLLGEIRHPERHIEMVKEVVGEDLQDLTCVVRTPALISFQYGSVPQTQQILLLGIDDETFGKVTDFRPYLTNALKRESRFSFELENSGYEIDEAGWDYRRRVITNRRAIEESYQRYQSFRKEQDQGYEIAAATYNQSLQSNEESDEVQSSPDEDLDENADLITDEFVDNSNSINFIPIPDSIPEMDELDSSKPGTSSKKLTSDSADGLYRLDPFDPSSQHRPKLAEEDLFDPMKDQYTGIILGHAISSRKTHDVDGNLVDFYMVKPGDDVQVMLASVGNNARPVSANCTVVDFYSSKMHEYDSSFAFMPLSELQNIRGMVDPLTGEGTVSTIQIKLKEGADLDRIRDQLLATFPTEIYGYDIRTWQDTQRPLLHAVNLELTILNILLFLIIAVAGFGILATFYMIVVEKTKDIGILKALGAPSRGVMAIFLGYGMSLGTVGTGVGISIGLLFVHYINDIADWVGKITGQEIFDPQFYYFSKIPTIVSPTMVLGVAVGAILIAVCASVLPALRAARLHPVKALSYE